MHRQRKKDLNLKPNRVLDKRSSRGMIYENEELRLRTLAIADDVDRGVNDIKKLRKENEHLKREIWALRDECEKLEEILKRVMISGKLDPLELSSFPDPFLFNSSEEDEEEGEDGEKTEEQVEEQEEGTEEIRFCADDADDSNDSVIEVSLQELPDPAQLRLESDLETPPPIIEITPAGSPSNSTTPPTTTAPKVMGTETSTVVAAAAEPVQEGGCVTQVPATYEATSSLQLLEPVMPPTPTQPRPHSSSSYHSLLLSHHHHCLPSSCYQSEPTLMIHGPLPPSPLPPQRQPSSSICEENMRLFQKNPKTLGKSPSPNNKKPLSRLLKTAPVVPSAPATAPVQQSPYEQDYNSKVVGGFFRTLSIEPRRDSTISQEAGGVAGGVAGTLMRRGSHTPLLQMQSGGVGNPHRPLSYMDSGSSTQYEGGRRMKSGEQRRSFVGGGGKKEPPLPWFGCWGNGCI